MTAFDGNGRYPSKDALTQMAAQAGFTSSKPLYAMLDAIYARRAYFVSEAKHWGVPTPLIGEIDAAIQARWAMIRV